MKTVDDILLEAIEQEVKQDMEKEASSEVSPSLPVLESSENYEEFQKIAQELRDLVKETTEPNAVQDFMQTVKSVEEK